MGAASLRFLEAVRTAEPEAVEHIRPDSVANWVEEKFVDFNEVVELYVYDENSLRILCKEIRGEGAADDRTTKLWRAIRGAGGGVLQEVSH